jgi:hypothetical protein
LESPDARGEAPHQAPFLGLHPPALGGLRVVVPYEVEEAVEREVGNLARVGSPRLAGLAPRRLEREVDLAEEEPRAGVVERLRLGHREGEDVGRLVDLAVIAVQPPEELVVGEDD